MRTRILLLASLLVGAMTMQAQTVTTNEGVTYKAENLKEHILENATSITISGNWSSDVIGKLYQALEMTEYVGLSRNNKLTTVTFDPDATIGSACSFISFTALKSVTMPTVANNAEVNFGNAFESCTSLTSVDLSSFTNISGMSHAFAHCRSLTSVKFAENVKGSGSLDNAFYNCKALTSEIDLSGFTGIRSMEHAFEGCEKLTSVKMPTTLTSTEINMGSAFYECSSLTSVIDMRAFTSVRDYTGTFAFCPKLTEVYLGTATVTSSSGTMSGTFMSCPKECKVYLPEGVTEVPEAWQSAPVTFMINGQPAGISTVGSEDAIPAISHVYTVDGRLVKTVPAAEYGKLTDGLDRGIYMVNGKKVAVE